MQLLLGPEIQYSQHWMSSQSILPLLLEISGSKLMFLCSLSMHRHFQTSVINFSSVNAVSQIRKCPCLSLSGLRLWQLWPETGQLSCVLPFVVKNFGQWSVQKCVLKHLWDQDLRKFKHISSLKNLSQWYAWMGMSWALNSSAVTIWGSWVSVKRQNLTGMRTTRKKSTRRVYRSAVLNLTTSNFLWLHYSQLLQDFRTEKVHFKGSL